MRWYHPALVAVYVAAVVLLVFTLTRVRNTTNTRSRIITVERLVERGTMAHVAPGDTTPFELSIDAVQIDGRMYSSKPPVYPLVMAGQSWVVKHLTGWHFYPHRKSYIRILTLMNQVLPFVVVLLLALLMASHYTRDLWVLTMLVLTLSVGSLAFGYAVTINNHTPAALALFGCLFLVWQLVYRGQDGLWRYLLFGLLAGFAAATDLPGLALAGGMWLVLLRHNWRMALPAAVLMVLPLLVTVLVFHDLTGSFKPLYIQPEYYQFEGSYWLNPEDHDTLREPKWLYLFHITFGHNGLFSLSPVLLLGVAGLVWLLRQRQMPERPLAALLALGMAAIFLFIWLKTSNYGGYCIGTRWFIVFMPLLGLMSLPALTWLSTRLWGRALAVALLLLSTPAVIQALYHDGFIRSFLEAWWIGGF